ncbi:hypothetical protein ES703_95672 [subsurface metagenome]
MSEINDAIHGVIETITWRSPFKKAEFRAFANLIAPALIASPDPAMMTLGHLLHATAEEFKKFEKKGGKK